MPPHKQGAEPDAGQLSKILRASGISLSPAQTGQLWKYHQLLRQYNKELNLTRILNFQSMVRKLYIDSIMPGLIIDLPSPLMDLGSGAGMPGIPLKIANPQIEIILAESRGNRVQFIETVIGELGLKKISILGRSVSASTETPVKGIITRALETIRKTLERIAGSLAKGGLAIFMKGPECDEEIEEALGRFGRRFRLIRDHHYLLPNSSDERRLVVFERLDSPPWARKAELAKENLVRIIESENNETFRNLKKLLAPRGIRKQLQAFVFGQKQVSEMLVRFPEKCVAWISRGDRTPPPDDSPRRMMWYQLAPPLYETLDLFGTSYPIVLVKIEEIPKWTPSDGLSEGCTLFVPFQDPENVGAVIRSAVAFGAAAIIMLAEAANPYHPKSVRASGGAVFRANLLEGPSIQDLSEDLPVVPLSKEGKGISDFKFPAKFGLLPGIEGPGLPDRFRKAGVSIPVSREVESLNAVVATAVALFVWARTQD
ncbi:MAG: 16S rRNA (guanine(527)-N(7))-methyltransferase RsmG [Syntrophobacteraceae bacterium]